MGTGELLAEMGEGRVLVMMGEVMMEEGVGNDGGGSDSCIHVL